MDSGSASHSRRGVLRAAAVGAAVLVPGATHSERGTSDRFRPGRPVLLRAGTVLTMDSRLAY
ncbi:twin-arginine translocation signal domain-containing protein [Plantactinospora sp. CA-294935]|uniref:twin-arginine translocation signal domain-containing protein n=1 Tax=Plantactinospora sp. CA-294935 TaxID=3240012 RepID=UPI003D9064FE